MSTSSQKFIARNRAPRVQIEYDVELYGAQKKVQLPFVMGVMSDLSGNPVEPLPGVGAQAPRFRRRAGQGQVNMAELEQNKQGGEAAVEMNDFNSLLQKQFKPQTDQAKNEVETAVRTLAQHALEQSTLISTDVVE